MNISLSGLNVFQTGNEAFAFVTGNNGATEMVNYQNELERFTVDSLLTENYQNLFQKTFAQNTSRFIDSSKTYNEALSQVNVSTLFPATRTGDRLKAVARSIAAHGALNMKRQTFFVQIGGWDHHSELNLAQDAMFPDLSASLNSFWLAMKELGLENEVVAFSASDFGRTLSPNTIGTDHAWGGNAFVMGGAVQGGKIYGTYPEIVLGSELDTAQGGRQRGRLIPTTSVDEYCSELAKWFGVSSTDLDTVFPNITNFYDPYSLNPPLGFLPQEIV